MICSITKSTSNPESTGPYPGAGVHNVVLASLKVKGHSTNPQICFDFEKLKTNVAKIFKALIMDCDADTLFRNIKAVLLSTAQEMLAGQEEEIKDNIEDKNEK